MKSLKYLLAFGMLALSTTMSQAGPMKNVAYRARARFQQRRQTPFVQTLPAACAPAACAPNACGPIQAIPLVTTEYQEMEAVCRGLEGGIAIGPFREATLAVREWKVSDGNDLTKLQDRLNRTPRFTACQKATMAVIALEMTNAFSPGTIPPQVLALAIQLQAQACGTPVPVPVPTPTPVPVPTS